MNTVGTATLGIIFLGLSFAATFLMFYLWGFPFDKATRTSAAPKRLMRLHRVIGYLYGLIYIVMMTQMVPRLWQYQVELPPRTVAHLILGFLIGILLLVKIAIMRFFRHLEEWMPYLGTGLFACTVLLLGLSLPFVFREQALASGAVGGDVFSPANRQRVAALLQDAKFPAGAPFTELTSVASLRDGRRILLDKCVRCHDLRTILERPRTPDDWVATVRRMAEKPALFAPITAREQQRVSAYLIAITPDLQQSAASKRRQDEQGHRAQTMQASDTAIDPVMAQRTFQKICSQCHATGEVDKSPPRTDAEINDLIGRMQRNGMHADAKEIRLIEFYLRKTYQHAPGGNDGK